MTCGRVKHGCDFFGVIGQKLWILTGRNKPSRSMAQRTPATPSAEIEDNLTVESFRGKFDVTDFVGTVSERLITQSKANAARMHRLHLP
jgi:hypothetical protein